MSKIWYCRTCGYEVSGRGRCHSCRSRLTQSPLPELAPGGDDDEVGYRLTEWTPRARGALIVALIDAGIEHRFEEEELVVPAEDEERTDDLVASVTADAESAPADESTGTGSGDADGTGEDDAFDEDLVADVELLYRAAMRLRADPTDMHADGDVAQASAVVFVADRFYGVDADTWAAVGRVTRRLLAALGADEALEDEIRAQAGILVKLLGPLVGTDDPEAPVPARGDATFGLSGALGLPGAGVGLTEEAIEAALDGRPVPDGPEEPGEPAADEADADDSDSDSDDDGDGDGDGDGDDDDGDEVTDEREPVGARATAGQTVYELPEWLPEQRAQLSIHLDEAGIDHTWEGGDLVVPEALEEAVEALFDHIDGVNAGEDDGERYRTLEALFAAADRLVNDPDSKTKGAEVVRAVAAADGPTPLGLDDAQWWSIRSRARTLADSIEHDANADIVFGEATTLRDLLRALV